MTLVVIKCHSDEESGNRGNGTGKPHKWETQILVGEPLKENKNLRVDGIIP